MFELFRNVYLQQEKEGEREKNTSNISGEKRNHFQLLDESNCMKLDQQSS